MRTRTALPRLHIVLEDPGGRGRGGTAGVLSGELGYELTGFDEGRKV
jgi:hypothetical protein